MALTEEDLDLVARRIIPNLEVLADLSVKYGESSPQRISNHPNDTDVMAGVLSCKICWRLIRDHSVAESCMGR